MLANAVLLAFPLFALWCFKRMPTAQAGATAVIVGSIFLPEGVEFDLAMIPPMDKEYITYLSVLLAAWIVRPTALRRARPFRGLESLVFAMLLANAATVLKNGQPMMDEGRLEDGLGIYWLFAQTTDDLLMMCLPYLLGRALFTSVRDLYVLIGVLVVAGVGYTSLIAIEFAMSIPFRVWQLNWVVYRLQVGGHPNFRWGMTQPVVFFENGLALASFMACTLVAAAAMVKAKLPLPRFRRVPRINLKAARHIITAGLLMTLNVAGNVYGLFFLIAHAMLRPRVIALLATALATLVVVYPTLRISDAFPHQEIVDFAAEYDEARARSLGGRFDEEEFVLSQIGDRLWFGWGTYARTPGVETFGDGEAGLDGWWTIRLGSSGIVGVLLYFAMTTVPAFRAWHNRARMHGADAVLIGSVMCMIALRSTDLLINGWWNSLPVFLSGALAGVVGGLRRPT